ncbi:Gpi16 subunit, GPI transamidase component, partial [Necator americanus]
SEYTLFPRILAEIISSHSVVELSFHLTQGRWYSSTWGLPPQPSGPTGGVVHAWILGNATTVDAKWRALINSLNGVFCTALTSVVPELTSSPKFGFKRLDTGTTYQMELRHSALGRETVCAENLTPWKKLLPCKQSGLVTLFNPIKLYKSVYHSMGFELHRACEGEECKWQLHLVMSNVVDIPIKSRRLDFSTFELFGRRTTGVCKAAASSKMLVQMDDENMRLEPAPSEIITKLEDRFAVYDLQNNKTEYPFSVSAFYGSPFSPKSAQMHALVSVSTFVGGSDQVAGVLASVLTNAGETQRVIYSHQLPWFLLVYYHTITLTCKDLLSGQKQVPIIYDRYFAPSITREKPALLEWDLDIPRKSECRLQISFDKAFMRIREYPPDANHGMYVPAATLTLVRNSSLVEENGNTTREGPITLYGNTLLIVLPVPDFSMPFNVICFVMTTVSLCFGPIHSFSTKMLIPVNSALPSSSLARKAFRLFLLTMLVLASYAQYKEMSLHEIRRSIEHFFDKMNSV